jgi:Holliday junction resolvase RusA-like endonuclease
MVSNYIHNLLLDIQAICVVEYLIKPEPADRPRTVGTKTVYDSKTGKRKSIPIIKTSEKYRDYLERLCNHITLDKTKFDNYIKKQTEAGLVVSGMVIVFRFNYPASTPKKHRIEGKLHKVKPDKDNLIKPILDSFVKVGIISDDGCITTIITKSTYTNEQPLIEVALIFTSKDA